MGIDGTTVTTKPKIKLEVNRREFASILAGLRALQTFKQYGGGPPNYNRMAEITNIADDRGLLIPLKVEDIDELCGRLNIGG